MLDSQSGHHPQLEVLNVEFLVFGSFDIAMRSCGASFCSVTLKLLHQPTAI